MYQHKKSEQRQIRWCLCMPTQQIHGAHLRHVAFPVSTINIWSSGTRPKGEHFNKKNVQKLRTRQSLKNMTDATLLLTIANLNIAKGNMKHAAAATVTACNRFLALLCEKVCTYENPFEITELQTVPCNDAKAQYIIHDFKRSWNANKMLLETTRIQDFYY